MRRAAHAAGRERRAPRRAHAAQLCLAAAAVLVALRTLLRGASRAGDDGAAFALTDASSDAGAAWRCYNGTSDDGGALNTVPMAAGGACVSYWRRCTAADADAGRCSAEEAAHEHESHVFGAMDAGACAGLARAGAYHGRYRAVRCCSERDLCNAPRLGAASSSSSSSSSDDATATGDDTTLRCALGTRGGSAVVVPAEGGRCVRYGAPCAAGDDCAAGATHRLVVGTASAAQCDAWRAARPETHAQLLCCSTPFCNDGREGGFAAASPPARATTRASALGHGGYARRAGRVRRAGGATRHLAATEPQ